MNLTLLCLDSANLNLSSKCLTTHGDCIPFEPVDTVISDLESVAVECICHKSVVIEEQFGSLPCGLISSEP